MNIIVLVLIEVVVVVVSAVTNVILFANHLTRAYSSDYEFT